MFQRAIFVCFTLMLAACASPARVGAMVGAPTVAVPANSPLKESILVNNVSGGQSTNPLWTSEVGNPEFQQALRQSLSAQNLLAGNGARFWLDATLVELKQPLVGFSLTVTSTVRYSVTDTAMNRVAFDQTISAEYTATVNDAFVAVERLRLANEGAIKNNISKFLDQLLETIGSGGTPVAALEIRKQCTGCAASPIAASKAAGT